MIDHDHRFRALVPLDGPVLNAPFCEDESCFDLAHPGEVGHGRVAGRAPCKGEYGSDDDRNKGVTTPRPSLYAPHIQIVGTELPGHAPFTSGESSKSLATPNL